MEKITEILSKPLDIGQLSGGQRVFCVKHVDDGILSIYGYGTVVLISEVRPSFEAVWESYKDHTDTEMTEEEARKIFEEMTTKFTELPIRAKIRLDSGKHLWDFQAHLFHPAIWEAVKEKIHERVVVVEVDVAQVDLELTS